MSLKLVLLFCIVAVAHASRPYLGVNIPYFGGRIVGGENAGRGEFPHQVSLQRGTAPILTHLCGGSILSNQWILTAGHCVLAVSGDLHVKAGKHSIRSTEKTEQTVKVVKMVVHEKFSGNVGPYDIALLKLEKPLVYDAHVQSIRLPSQDSEVDGDVVLSGWGSVGSSGWNMPDILQKVKLPIVDVKTCKEAIESITGSAPVAPSNICTGPLSGGVSACNGDSGGPLIKLMEDGKAEVIGIVSWGVIPCGTRGAPSVYTRVSSYIDWIQNIMDNN